MSPVLIRKTANRSIIVAVQQTVHDLESKLCLYETIEHAFRLEAGRVTRFDIQSASQLSAIGH